MNDSKRPDKKRKIRIDQLMVQRGLVESREQAQRLILAHKVMIGEKYMDKPGQSVAADAEVRLLEDLKYVSRGGTKLERALDAFEISVQGKVAMDVGASTGGFTDCLLQRGALKVYSIDVGYGQLAWRLREDSRVVVRERVNARYLGSADFPERIDFAVMDVSFISAKKILEPLSDITTEVIFLLKPQFEAGPEDVPRGGVIRDTKMHAKILARFFADLARWKVVGLIDSPIVGSSGNREFLVHVTLAENGWSPAEISRRIEELTMSSFQGRDPL